MRPNQSIVPLLALCLLFFSCNRENTDRNAPRASFTYRIQNCESPWEIKFYNHSENADSYEWYGPEGGLVSTEEDPTLVLDGNGPFDIRLVVVKVKRKKRDIDEMSVDIDPVAETSPDMPTILPTIQSCTPPYAVYLRATGTIRHDQFWRFHDGSTSTQSSLNRTYPAMGQYLVELGNIRCGDTAWATVTVDISPVTTAPQAGFGIAEAVELEEGIFLAGSSITFENTSGLADEYVWVYPGGTSSGTDLEVTLPEGLHEIELQAWCGTNVDVETMMVNFAYPAGFQINTLELRGVRPFPWDLLDPEPNSPDMYLGLFAGTTQIGAYTSIEPDFQQGATVSWSVDFTCADIDQIYTIKGYDDDDFIDQLVGEADFRLRDVLQANPGVLVSSFSAENQGFVVEVYGEWY